MRQRKLNLKLCITAIVSLCSVGQLTVDSLVVAQEKAAKAKPKNPFSAINGQLLKVRFNGNNLVYSKSVVVGKDGKKPVVIQEPVTQTYTVMVPFTELVDGKKVAKFRAEARTRTVVVTKVINGEYKTQPEPLGEEIKFLALNGSKLKRDQVVKAVGMKETVVLVIPESQSVPDSWKSILRKDALIVQSNKLYSEAFKNR